MNSLNTADEGMIDSGKAIRDFILKYLKKAHWFLLGILICLSLAFFKIKKLVPNYHVSATLLIKNDINGNVMSEGSAFQDLGYGTAYYAPENEIEILKSRSLIQKVVQDLKLNCTILKSSGLKTVDLYGSEPFTITFLSGDSSIYNSDANFLITPISDKQFRLDQLDEKEETIGNFGSSIATILGPIIFTPTPLMKENRKYMVQVNSFESTVNQFAAAIQIENIHDYSNVIKITLDDPSEFKALDFINNLLTHYQKDAIKDKNQVAQNSADFITDRINYITKELNVVESDVQNYKSSQHVFDVVTEKDIFLDSKNENEKKIIENEINLHLVEYINSYVAAQNDPTLLIPNNIGLTESAIQQQIDVCNSLILERNRLLKTSSTKNPVALNLESKILSLQANLRQSLKRLESRIIVERAELDQQARSLQNQIESLPRKEKELREIQRQQQIKESLYLYLLQKREETAITLSLTVPNSKIIDKAFCTGVTFSPNKKTLIIFALALGLMIPFVILFILDQFDNKVKNKEEIEKHGLDVLCEIPQSKVTTDRAIFTSVENTALAESFRLLRTNVNFKLNITNQASKVIVVTSTVPNEGKSFITLNLAKSLSILGKKVLVLGLDLRSPTLNKYVGIPNQIGVSNYIIDQNLTLDHILIKQPMGQEFDLISSGDIPPNPSELLLHPRMDHLFKQAKDNYDYIVVDTPPVAVVSDTLLLTPYSDMFLYIVRERFTQRKHLKQIQQLRDKKRLPNLNIVLNYTKEVDSYGYSYYQNERSAKDNFLSRFRRKS